MYHNKQAFSLVETSIVMAIIGLILAAALGGKALIESSKLQTVIADITSYKAAINSFSSKYDALPGDFSEADVFWTGATNGDNNQSIEFQNSNDIYEGYLAWQHLSHARILEQILVGTQTTNTATIGVDVPESEISGGGYFFDFEFLGIANNNTIALGRPEAPDTSSTPDTMRLRGLLTASQSLELDNKSDDGIPTSGSIRGADGWNAPTGTCINGNVYNISQEIGSCIISFRITGL